MGKKILVVEDDPDILRILSHALRGGGYLVTHAYGGEDAIRKILSEYDQMCVVVDEQKKVATVMTFAFAEDRGLTPTYP